MNLAIVIVCFVLYAGIAHFISYHLEKKRILNGTKWDLNICCGKTDGGGVNADIMKHKNLPRFKLIHDIYNLPFREKEFRNVLCSHTLEHVEHPDRFFAELQRVGENVTVVVPPLYDICALMNVFEHKHIFLILKKTHNQLPKYVKLPFSGLIQRKIGQINHA